MASNRNNELSAYLAKLEATDGTDAVPTAGANALALADMIQPDYDFAFKHQRPTLVQGHLNGTGPLQFKGKIYNWTKRAWYRGRGVALTGAAPAEIDPWLQAAGYAVSYDATVSAEKAVYDAVSTGISSMTEYWYEDGMLFKGVGARNDMSFSFDVGGPVIVESQSHGTLLNQTAAALVVPTYETVVPPVATDLTSMSIDGYAAGIVRKFAVKLGTSIHRRDGVKSTGGVAGFRIASRKITWEAVIEEPLISDHDFRVLMETQANVALAATVGVQYNSIGFASSTARVEKVTPSADNHLKLITVSGGIYGAPFPMTITLT